MDDSKIEWQKSKNHTDVQLRSRAVFLYKYGQKTIDEIHDNLGISRTSIRTYVSRFDETGDVLSKDEIEKKNDP